MPTNELQSSHFNIYNLTIWMERVKHASKRRSLDFRLTSVAQKRLCLSSLISLHVHRLWISLLIEFSSKTDKRNITKKLIRYLRFISVEFIHSCHHCLKMSSFSLEKNRFRSMIWHAGDQLTTAFTILNCLEYEFFKGFLVQGRQQSFLKSSILPNIVDLQWCLPNKRKIHSQLSAMFYLPRWQRWQAQ